MKGYTKNIINVHCGLCNGSGKYNEEMCPGCEGKGKFPPDRQWVYCTRCRGAGLFNLEICAKCKGFGKIWID